MNKDILRDIVRAFVGVGMSLAIVRLISKSWIGIGLWERVYLVFVGMALLACFWNFILTRFLEK